MKVAQYAVGEPGTVAYEKLSFWADKGKRTDVYYAYGKDQKEVKLKYVGKKNVGGAAGFVVRFPNNHTMTVAPSGTALKVTDATEAPKLFVWQYEGPVNGVGTYCRECAENEKEALQFLQTYYLK
ncbi:hypothetical protein [Hymenobacter daeguensis]